ncbi:MAG: nitrate- and nitrite sensing domain-containing protein [Trebonia sp.]
MPLAGGSAGGDGWGAVGGRDAASMGPQLVTGPAASGGQPQAGPPPAAGMAGTTHPHPRRPGSARSRFALSNWRVQWRLALLIAVPFLTAAVLGAAAINGDVNNWQTTGRVQHLAQLNSAVVKYIAALEDERDYSVASTANRAGFSARLRAAERVTDTVAAEIHALVNGITVGGGYQLVAVQAANAVQVGVETLPLVREAVTDPLFPASAITQVYTVNIIQPANTLTSVVGNEASGTDLRRDVTALGALLQVQDSTSVQRAILLRAVSLPPPLSSDDDASLQQALPQAQRQEAVDLTNFNASVDPAEQRYYTDTVSGPPVDRTGHEESLALALLPGASSAHPLTPANARTLAAANVNDDMSFTIDKVRQVADELNGNISTLANASRTNASTRLLVTSLVTVLLLLLVLLISTLVARSLTRPLRKLRTDALDVAGNRLPEMVRRLSQSEGADESVDIEPIGVTSTDEIGEVARAFDQVHREAVRLAADEAILRGNLSAMFVNLSRRSQSLVERQIRVIATLEQSEQDTERLSSLFQVDHLATRMRRNSENLLVLAGLEFSKRSRQPVTLVDVVRAAVSEIEQYERVVMNVQSGVWIRREAVRDVVHLTAELVENATTFSAADTPVTIETRLLSSGGALIEIADQGLGARPEALDSLNWRLDNPPTVDVEVSRRMGLFVVAQLAARHGIRVRLLPAVPSGLIALVWLPDHVITVGEESGFGPLRSASGNRTTGHVAPARETGQDAGTGRDRIATAATSRMGDRLRAAHLREDVGSADSGSVGWRESTPHGQVTVPIGERRGGHDQLPIFEAVESDWFRAGRQLVGVATKDDGSWFSSADDGYRAAEAVREPTSVGTTHSGLPKRAPGANRVPGTAAASAATAVPSHPKPRRSATDNRNRLASYQSGLQQGRVTEGGGNPDSGAGTGS